MRAQAVAEQHGRYREEVLRHRADLEEPDADLVVRRQERHLAADGVLGNVQESADADVDANRREVGRRQRRELPLLEPAQEEDEPEIEERPVRPAAVAAAPAPVIARARAALDLVGKDCPRHAVDGQQHVVRSRVDNDARQDLMVDPFHKEHFLQSTEFYLLFYQIIPGKHMTVGVFLDARHVI